MGKRVGVIGEKGREHALCKALSESSGVDEVIAMPGSAGMRNVARPVHVVTTDYEAIHRCVIREKFDLVVIGPEEVLEADIAGRLRKEIGVPVFGPSATVARLETSKIYGAEIAAAAKIPIPRFVVIENDGRLHASDISTLPLPCAVKADGPAGGKGVELCSTYEEVNRALASLLKRFPATARRVLVQELLRGGEISLHALSDGKLYLLIPPIRDYKRKSDEEGIPNGGGWGSAFPAYSKAYRNSLPSITSRILNPILDAIHEKEGEPFIGCFYPAYMAGRIIEWNCRFGDSEAQVILPCIDRDHSNFCELILVCATGRLKEIRSPVWRNGFAVCVVLASEGYPTSPPRKKYRIYGIEDVEAFDPDVHFLHAGTELYQGSFYAAGGRVGNIVAFAPTLAEAIQKTYEALKLVRFKGMQYRLNIGYDLLNVV